MEERFDDRSYEDNSVDKKKEENFVDDLESKQSCAAEENLKNEIAPSCAEEGNSTGEEKRYDDDTEESSNGDSMEESSNDEENPDDDTESSCAEEGNFDNENGASCAKEDNFDNENDPEPSCSEEEGSNDDENDNKIEHSLAEDEDESSDENNKSSSSAKEGSSYVDESSSSAEDNSSYDKDKSSSSAEDDSLDDDDESSSSSEEDSSDDNDQPRQNRPAQVEAKDATDNASQANELGARITQLTGGSSKFQGIDEKTTQELVKRVTAVIRADPTSKQKKLSPDEFQEKVQSVCQEWLPKTPTITLFIRWATACKRNFNADSISCLHTVAYQCNQDPLTFLDSLKSYRLVLLTKKVKARPYRFQFHFARCGSTVQTSYDAAEVKKALGGLKVSLACLQQQIKHPGNLAQAGKKRKRDGTSKDGGKWRISEHIEYEGKSLLRCHLLTTFEARVWLEVKHRFLAFHVVNTIFRVAVGQGSVEESECLKYSYHTLSAARERSHFLEGLSSLCTLYRDLNEIRSHREELKKLWEDRESNPQGLYNHANTGMTRVGEPQVGVIEELFATIRETHSARYFHPCNKKSKRQEDVVLAKWWTCIRAQVFKWWLNIERNSKMKEELTLPQYKTNTGHQSSRAELLDTPESDPEPDSTSEREDQSYTPRPDPNRLGTEEIANLLVLNDNQDPTPPGHDTAHTDPNPTNSPLTDPNPTVTVAPHKDPNPTDEPMLTPKDGAIRGDHSIREQNLTADIPEDNPKSIPQGHETPLANPNPMDERTATSIFESLCADETKMSLLHLVNQAFLDERVRSFLKVATCDMVYHLHLAAPLEFYLATHLNQWYHQREVGNPQLPFTVDHNLTACHIGSHAEHYIDTRDALYVVRFGSPIFQENRQYFEINISKLFEGIILHGEPDFSRSHGGYRVHIAIAGQAWDANGAPLPVGFCFGDKCCTVEDGVYLRYLVGRLVLFGWHCAESTQRYANRPSLACNDACTKFAKKLRNFLKISDDRVDIESVTLAITLIYPIRQSGVLHKDKMNCLLYAYCKTSTISIPVADEDGNIYLLQIILNYRKVVTNHLMPYWKSLVHVAGHMKMYLAQIEQSYIQLFNGRGLYAELPTPTDRTYFYLDKDLPFQEGNIGTKTHPQTMPLLLLPIGCSRVFSFSMAIDAIFKLRRFLTKRQVFEMAFIGSLLNTPVRFYYVVQEMTSEAREGKMVFDEYPMYQWLERTIDKFGNWQGGCHQRWSPSSIDDLAKLFGG